MRKSLKRNLIIWLSLLGIISAITIASIPFWLPQAVRSYLSFQGFQVSRFDLTFGVSQITIQDMVISQKSNDLVFDLTLPEVYVDYGFFSGIKHITFQNPRLVVQYCPLQQSRTIHEDLSIGKWLTIKEIEVNNLYVSRMHCYPDVDISEFFVNFRLDQRRQLVSLDAQHLDWSLLVRIPFKQQKSKNEWASKDASIILKKLNNTIVDIQSDNVLINHQKGLVNGSIELPEVKIPYWGVNTSGQLSFQQDKPKQLSWKIKLDELKQAPFVFKGLNLTGQLLYPRHHQRLMAQLEMSKWLHGHTSLPNLNVALSVERTLDGVNVTANLRDVLDIYLDVDFDGGDSRAMVSVKAKTQDFSKKALHLPIADKDIYLRSGVVELFGTVNINLDTKAIVPNLKMKVKKLAIEGSNWYVGAIQAILQFGAKSFRSTTPLTIEKIKGPFELSKLVADFEGSYPQILKLKTLKAKLADGMISLVPNVIDFSKEKIGMSLRLDKLQLTQLLKIFDWDEMKGKGKISGLIPIELSKEGIRIDKGVIRSEGPGTLQYHPSSDSTMAQQINDYSPVPLKVLSDYQYQMLNIDIVHQGRDTQLMTRLSGRNPDFENGRLVDLNLNLNIQLSDILKSLWATDEIEASLFKKQSNKR